MNNFDRFVTTVPKLRIGQRVRVVGKYAADWREPCIVVGIEFDARDFSQDWSISIMPVDEINKGYGRTDGFTEADLVPA